MRAQPKRVLHVAWEYPPLIYGGLGRHVEALTQAQAARGDEVIVLTQAEDDQLSTREEGGITVIRAPHDPTRLPFNEDTLLDWVSAMQKGMLRATGVAKRAGLARPTATQVAKRAGLARPTATRIGPVDIVHAHDWVTADVAIELRDALPGRALIATIHATEAGRHQGWLPGPLSDAIHSTEHRLVHEAQGVIVCSRHMRDEIERLFGVPADRVNVIANGIDLERWQATSSLTADARKEHAPEGPLIVFVGRLEWEKGAHTLVDALPGLRHAFPRLRAVIAGRGGHEHALEEQVRSHHLADVVDFAGWLPEDELHALIAAADVLVVPSIYEPFGMVAIEAAALGTPLVVARTGGLAEFVTDGETGRTFAAGDASALAAAVSTALRDPDGSARMARMARARLRDSYTWELLAEQTDAAYTRALASPRPRATPLPRIPDRSVNLLRD